MLSITRRDLIVATVAVAATMTVVSAARQQTPGILHSTAFDWNSFPVTKTDIGETRPVIRQKTATLDELEMHVTTLNAGQTSHAPHQHVNEELVIIREGTVEVLVQGVWKRVGPGSIIFNASNELHALRNVGTGPTTYHVINWTPPAK